MECSRDPAQLGFADDIGGFCKCRFIFPTFEIVYEASRGAGLDSGSYGDSGEAERSRRNDPQTRTVAHLRAASPRKSFWNHPESHSLWPGFSIIFAEEEEQLKDAGRRITETHPPERRFEFEDETLYLPRPDRHAPWNAH